MALIRLKNKAQETKIYVNQTLSFRFSSRYFEHVVLFEKSKQIFLLVLTS